MLQLLRPLMQMTTERPMLICYTAVVDEIILVIMASKNIDKWCTLALDCPDRPFKPVIELG